MLELEPTRELEVARRVVDHMFGVYLDSYSQRRREERDEEDRERLCKADFALTKQRPATSANV